jgi:hypothetical protein
MKRKYRSLALTLGYSLWILVAGVTVHFTATVLSTENRENGTSAVVVEEKQEPDSHCSGEFCCYICNREAPSCTQIAWNKTLNIAPEIFCDRSTEKIGNAWFPRMEACIDRCRRPNDTREVHKVRATECIDGVDNDNDGLIDLFDKDCSAISDTSERAEEKKEEVIREEKEKKEISTFAQPPSGLRSASKATANKEEIEKVEEKEDVEKKIEKKEESSASSVASSTKSTVDRTTVEKRLVCYAADGSVVSERAQCDANQRKHRVANLRDVQKDTPVDSLPPEVEEAVLSKLQEKFAQNDAKRERKMQDLLAALTQTRERVTRLEKALGENEKVETYLQDAGVWIDEQIAYFTVERRGASEVETTVQQLKELIETVRILATKNTQTTVAPKHTVEQLLQRTGQYLLRIYKVLLITAREGMYVDPVILEEFQKAAKQYTLTQKQCEENPMHCTGLRDVIGSLERMAGPLKTMIDKAEGEAVREEMIGILEE